MTDHPPTSALLVVNPQAGGLSEADERVLREALPGFELRRLQEGEDVAALLEGAGLAPAATVIVAGGDGTVGRAARALAGTGRSLGIVPLGTFNNFARALGMPLDAGAAAAALASGRPGRVTLGRVNGRPFLEAASCGLFGDLVNLGEAAKELRYGELWKRVRGLSAAAFEYRVSGDVRLAGRARAIVAANTPSIGALVPVGDVTPREPVLELSVRRGFLRRTRSRRIRRIRIETEPAAAVYADADRAGDTPAEIEIDADALRVILPEKK